MTGIHASALTHADRSFPRLHPRPRSGWLNDPNGILFANGRWHLFFQYNPDSARHERIHWGHMSSADLLRWEEHPIALAPQPDGPDALGCWSGVGVIDDGVPALVYSAVRADDGRSEVAVVRGAADATTWDEERTIAARRPEDDTVTMVRDPFVFTLGGHRWAIQGAARADAGALLLYDADDLGAWEERGVLLTADDDVAARLPACDGWECPQLVRVGDDWALLVSLWREGLPHLGVGYIVGSLEIDASTGLPAFTGRSTGILDGGSSFYAPQAVQSSGDGRVLLWGWAQEVAPEGVRQRTVEETDAHGWSGVLTFPRELTVHGDAVELTPARELTALRTEAADAARLPDQAEVRLTGAGSASLRLSGSPGPSGGNGGSDGSGDSAAPSASDATDQVVWSGELRPGDEVRILIDASLIEVHPSGRPSLTLRAYPGEGERYRVVHEPGVGVSAWRLAIPS